MTRTVPQLPDDARLAQQIMDHSPSAIIVTDGPQADYRIVYVNAAFERETGYTQQEVVGKNPRFLHGDDTDQPAIAEIRAALAEERACTVLLRNYRKDGGLFWNELRLAPLHDAEGNLTHYIGIQNDVTARIRMQKTYETIVTSAVEGIAITQDWQTKFASGAIERLTGYPIEEYLALPIEQLIHPDFQEQIKDQYTQYMTEQEGPDKIVFRSVHKDGSVWWCETHITLIEHEGRLAIQHVFFDVTAREEALDQLRRTSANLRAMLNSAKQSFFLIDREARIIEFDEGSVANALDIFGERLYPGVDVYKFVREDEVELFSQDYKRVLQGETITSERTHYGQNRTYHFEVTMYPVVDEAGDILGACISSENITERKLAETALQESEALYRLLAENSDDLIALHNPDGTFIYASPSFERTLGFTLDDLLNMTTTRHMVHPDDAARAMHSHQRVLDELATIEIDYRLQKKDGSYLWVSSYSKPILDEQGEVKRLLAVSRDISQRKRMEDRIRASEEQFRALVEHSPDLIVRLLRDSTHVYANPALLDVVGMTLDEIMGKTNDDLQMPLDIQAQYDEIREDIYETGQARELEVAYPGVREAHTYHLRLVPEFDGHGQVSSILSIARDITERKQMEGALRESEERFRQLAENIEACFWLLDIETEPPECLYVSPAYDTIWQRSHLELMEKGREVFVPTLHPEDHDWALNTVRDWLRRRIEEDTANPTGATCEITHRIVRPSGDVRSVRTKYFPVRNASGHIYRLAIITQDITDELRLQEKEQALRLERERSQLIASFIENISHEFRTPLAIVSSSAYLLEHTEDKARRTKKITQIEAQVQRITHLVDTMLLMAKLDIMNTVQRQPVQLRAAIDETLAKFGAAIRGKNLSITVHIANGAGYLMGDEDLLKAMFHQLLKNAIHHCDEGGQVEIAVQNTGEDTQIAVSNTGEGILAEHRACIFERFYRADPAHGTEGLGLGLAITQKIAELHGGSIQVESEPQAGATFTVQLPTTGNV